MLALQLTAIGQNPEAREIPEPKRGAGENTVLLKAAAMNRRDHWIVEGHYPKIRLPVTLGSDGAGICDGKEVLINPGIGWGVSEAAQSKDFRILGMPDDGTFAQHVVVRKENIFPKPMHLSWEEGAALPLAGVTAYRALFVRGQCRPGQRLLITGIGGGVALTAMQMAISAGLEVYVTSGDNEKLRRATELGAAGTANYREPDWPDALRGQCDGVHIILDSAGGEGFGHLLKLTLPGGCIVTYGGTAGVVPNFSPQVVFWRQLSLLGSTMGSPADFQAMLDFVTRHEIRPVIDSVFALDEAESAFDRLAGSAQFVKIVFTIRQ